jgi:hypothetical protein
MERKHLENPGIDRKIILKTDLQEVAWGDMDWSDTAQDRENWREIRNAIINIRLK